MPRYDAVPRTLALLPVDAASDAARTLFRPSLPVAAHARRAPQIPTRINAAISSACGERSPAPNPRRLPCLPAQCDPSLESAEFRLHRLGTGLPPSLVRRAASSAAPAHAAIPRRACFAPRATTIGYRTSHARPQYQVHHHQRAQQLQRLFWIAKSAPAASPRATTPVSAAPPPARCAVAPRAMRTPHYDVSFLTTAALRPGSTLSHSWHDHKQHHPHAQHARRPLTIPGVPLASLILSAFAPTRLTAATPFAHQHPHAQLDPCLFVISCAAPSHPLPPFPTVLGSKMRLRVCSARRRDILGPCARVEHHRVGSTTHHILHRDTLGTSGFEARITCTSTYYCPIPNTFHHLLPVVTYAQAIELIHFSPLSPSHGSIPPQLSPFVWVNVFCTQEWCSYRYGDPYGPAFLRSECKRNGSLPKSNVLTSGPTKHRHSSTAFWTGITINRN
ncbi:hypothetical protein B0H19DRAFT_1262487 [Mycena capillaripes]|nr:hypothetical protein B0H19DRAFT_1262487 [Mycena capillaripes]